MANHRPSTDMTQHDLYPLRQTLQRAARSWPDAPALSNGQQVLSYQVLAELVARRADGWRAAGLVSGDRIGIAASRSIETIVSIVAAVESGLAYVPLDLGYPSDRLQAMLDDAQVRAVVGEPDALTALQARLDAMPSLAALRPAGPAPHAAEGDLVYVLFTSGSTGRPKGVAMGLAPLAHLTGWHVAHARLGQAARTLQFAPLSFDVHFQEIFSTLATGGTLILPEDADRRDPARLRELLAREGVQRLYLPYVALQMLAQADAEAHTQPGALPLSLEDVVSAGEQLQVTPDIRALFGRLSSAALHNHYGPTETHVVTAFELHGDASDWPQIPPIGSALPHVRVWLRPAQDDDAPEAHTAPSELSQGELMLGGDTLADGYLGRPDLTAERFLDNLTGPDGVPARWYATGDLVRQDSDGTLTYLGRADQQLKVDGFRIEPGDIELALMANPGIQDAVVTAPADPDGSRVLTAHIVLRAGATPAELAPAAWRAWLRDRLPEYMVPVRFAVLDKLPTTPSGKIDRRGLPSALPTAQASGARPAAASGELIDRLRALWLELLGLDQLPDDANVFDNGARSLLVMRFVSRAREQGVQLNVADVYDRPTVAGLSALLASQANPGQNAAGNARARRHMGASTGEGMAIVGMSARVGTATDVDTFWQQLLDNVETLRRFRPEEIDPAVPASLRGQPNFVAARGVLHQADCFDAGFFGLSAREATLTDPQQRLFLELCWSALEHAGIDPSKLGGEAGDRVGVYAGTANNAYLPAMRAENPELIAQAGEFAAMLANEKDYVATRVAHRLNFNGPAVSIHTACSTSLVAVAQAWHALAQGQCDIALAGGATVIVPQLGGYLHVEGGMESADGRCRPFDAQASGTVFGSGGGVVVLKRLSQALADGDTIYGVIEGVGLNNDGADKASFTAPSVSGQAQAIRMALEHANVSARQIGYVEAHGTGTALGDPIEVAALSRAWSQDTRDTGFCTLGSVKGHVGHLVAAAGVVGLIKATLSLHHGRIPGTLHFDQPNPQIDFAQSPFQVSAQVLDWPRSDAPRRAAVSSFGVGGTNAHVIVAEAPLAARQTLPAAPGMQLLPISARHPEALLQRARDLANHLERHPELPLAAVSATLLLGRQAMPQRQCVVAENRDEAITALRAIAQGQAAQRGGRVVFAFPGQGSQHPGMARELVEQFPAFQHAFDEVLAAAPDELAATLRHLLVDAAPTDELAAARLAETRLAQPALFAVSHALAAWLDSLGLRPHALIGHSIGEYAAACHAGVLSPQDAMRAVIERGQAMFEQTAGSMLAVRTGLAALQPLPAGIDVAAVNAPELTVLAGPHADIDALAVSLEQHGIAVTRLKVSHAFHSASMEGALPRVQAALSLAKLSAPGLPMYSCVSGAHLSAEQATNPAYWASQVRAPVAFSQAVQAEQALGDVTFIEVGPGQALTALIRQHRVQGTLPKVVPLLSSAQAALPPARHALQALGQLWCVGLSPAWPLPARTPRVALPTYPFRREVHWFKRGTALSESTSALPTVSSPVPSPSSKTAMNRLPRIEQEIVRILADVAGLPSDAADREATFVDQGLDSLSLTQATLAFEQAFGIRLRFRRLLEDLDTLPKLAAFFDGELPADRFAEAPAAAAPEPAAATLMAAPQQAIAVTPLPQAMVAMAPMAPMAVGNGVQAVIQQQMLLMQQQLALLAGQPMQAVQAMPVAPAAAAIAPVAAAPVAAPAAATAAPASATMADAQPGKNALVEKPFGASARIVLTAQNEYTPAQQRWIDDFIRDYNARTGSSKSFSQQHRKVMADPRVVTGFNPQWKDLVYPIVADRSEGARVWDIDGNEYIDLLSCFGANFLGYKRADVTQAMVEQLHKGIEVGPQHPLAADVAHLISEFTGMERVGFCNTGSEAVMGAMRIARTVTGRKKIAIFNNSYHGIFDEVIVRGTKQLRSLSAAPGILANAVENILVLDYDSPESLEVLRKCAHELAAIMIEPIQNKYPTLQPTAFVQQLREIATKGGAALIFDEVVTGFRVAPGGAQEFYGVRADIATYGKIIGGGLPFAAIAGNSQWLDALDGGHWQYGDDSYPEAGVTYFAGTFVRHPLALAAAHASLLHIKRGGRAMYQAINSRTQRMVDRINTAFASRGSPVKAVHCASLWRLQWDDNVRNISLFYYLARFRGLHLYEQFGHFVTEAMNDADCDRIADTFIGVMDELMGLGLIAPRDGGPGAPVGSGGGAGGASVGGGSKALPASSSASFAKVSASASHLKEAPLSPGQTERWLAGAFDQGARQGLNEAFSLRLSGDVNRAALKQALRAVLDRHEAFRTRFDLEEPRQVIVDGAQVPIQEVDLRQQSDANAALDAWCDQANRQDLPFDRAPLASASLIELPDGRVAVHIVASHVIFDGWAASVFNAELVQAYRARCVGLQPDFEPAESPLAFSVAEQARFEGPEGQESLAHWKRVLANPPAPLTLGDRSPNGPRTFAADTVRGRIDATTTQALRQQARQAGATLFQLMLAAVSVVLRQRSGQDEFVVSVPYASQALAKHGPLLADGVLDLPLRLSARAGETPREVLARVRNQLMDALEYPLVTQGTVARALGIRGTGDRPPLTGVFFNLNPKVELSYDAAVQAEMEEGRRQALLSEILFNFYDQGDAITLDLHHSSEFCSLQRAQELVQALVDQCRLLAHGLDAPIAAQALSPQAARLALVDPRIRAWNEATRVPIEPAARVEQWFLRQVQQTPDAIAVVAQGQRLTYAELDARANQFAHLLQGLGVTHRSLVGVCMSRNIELVPALLGIFKAGGAYVPLDPSFPKDRLHHMTADAQLQAVITESAHAHLSGMPRNAQLRTDDDLPALNAAPTHAVTWSSPAPADAQSYVIYTSGSTGKPKGVVLQQDAVCNLMASMRRDPGMVASDRLLAVITLSFDMAVPELFLPLVTGARVVIARREETMDAQALAALIEAEGINVMQATPTTWHMLADAGWKPKPGFKGMTGGEPLTPALAKHLLHAGVALWNLYGPTETTVYATGCRVTDHQRITVGGPVDNTQCWVLDEQGMPCGVGQEGELCVGGLSVAQGYLHRPELTAEKFIPDPFSEQPGALLYRTGDLARWAADGQIEHLGRLDFQIKIRGYRIELGEIETRLAAQPGVSRTVVMAREDQPGDIRLVAYVQTQPGVSVDAQAVRLALKADLPDYMVPQFVIALPALPLLPNGKVDRKALPAPSVDDLPPASTGTAPSSETEQGVATAMQAVLKSGPLGLEDDFFSMGGHSLLAARLIAQLNKQFGVQLQLRALFESPTVGKLAAAIVAQQGAGATPARPPLVRRADRDTAPLTVMQQRVAFMEAFQPGRVVYHAPSGHRFRGPMNLAAFNRAYREMARRQEALRASIVRRNGELIQLIDNAQQLPDIPLLDLTNLPEAEREAAMQRHMNELVAQTFELDHAPLIRSQLYKLAGDHHGFFLMAHHIVWDGASFDVLYRELSAHYAAFAAGEEKSPLPELAVDQGDFAAWHNAWMKGDEIKQQLRFWEDLANRHPQLGEPPIDRARPETPSGNGATAFLGFDQAQSDAVRAIARQTGSPVSIVFLAVYAALMSEWMDESAPGIGLPVRGRPAPELEHVMGFFNNMLPMRVAVQPAIQGLSGLDWVREVRRQVTGALSNQDVPFELIAQQLKLKSAKLYQVLFNFQDVRDRLTRWGDLDHERVNLLKYGATEDLNFWLVEEKDKIAGGFQYDTDVLLPATAEALRDRFVAIVQRLIEQPNRLMNELLAPTEAQARALQSWQAEPLGDGLAALDAVHAPAQPDGIALSAGARTVTAAELAKRVRHAADTLRNHLGPNVPMDAVVGVDVADPVAEVVACLAVWQLGLGCAAPTAGQSSLPGTPGLYAVVSDHALSGVQHLGAHLLPGFVPTSVARPATHPSDAGTVQAVNAAQANEAACRLNQQLGAGFGQRLTVANELPALTRAALVLAARLKQVSAHLLAAGEAPDGTAASAACLGASAALAAVRSTTGRPHAIILSARDTQASVLKALFAAPVHVASLLPHPASGLPVAAGWLSDEHDVGVCGRPLLTDLRIVDSRAQAVGINAPGHLAGDGQCAVALRWRADGQLQCLSLSPTPSSVAPKAAAAPTVVAPPQPALEQPAQGPSVTAMPIAPIALSQPAPAAFATPATQPAEAILIGIWQNLLGVSGIAPQDNFFELGGNSLLAMVAVDETRKALGVEIDARRFVYESLAQIASSAAPAVSGSTSANDAPHCPPASPDRGAPSASSAPQPEAAPAKRRGWLDRARDALGQRTGTDGSR